MKKNDKLFVRIDHMNPDSDSTSADFEEHSGYVRALSAERYLIAGGFRNAKGGMIVFEAKDIDEAKTITEKDPFIMKKLFSYELYEWELFILSEEATQ